MGSTAVPNYSGRRAHTLGLSLPLQYLTHCFRFGKAGGEGRVLYEDSTIKQIQGKGQK